MLKHLYTDSLVPFIEGVRSLWSACPEMFFDIEPRDPLELAHPDPLHRHGLVLDGEKVVGHLGLYHFGKKVYQAHACFLLGYRGKTALEAIKKFITRLFSDTGEIVYTPLPKKVKHSRFLAAALGGLRYQDGEEIGYHTSKKLWEV